MAPDLVGQSIHMYGDYTCMETLLTVIDSIATSVQVDTTITRTKTRLSRHQDEKGFLLTNPGEKKLPRLQVDEQNICNCHG
nr:hypothetical protein [Desulfobacterales bacterium]